MPIDINAAQSQIVRQLRIRAVNDCIPKFAEAAIRVAIFVRENKYDAILMSGRSSLISREFFSAAWRALFPEIPLPKIYNFGDTGNFILYKGSLDSASRVKSAQSYIDSNFPDLNLRRSGKLCFVDDCALAGGKRNGLRDIFERLGFDRVDFAFLASSDRFLPREQDYVAIKDSSIAGTVRTFAGDIGLTDPEMNHAEIIHRTIAIIGMQANRMRMAA